ncbi:MAG: phosphoribosylglycinamide formyltransferase [Syntrophomonadaceae bacterium]|jgi:phosphoribosylglycinamide formyltransferase-1|nr:phosphoribosylglycinamide formyltransferase [Syntrophomonadaceae bacterium]
MMRVRTPGQLNVGILASGRGSNFEAIADAIERGDISAEIKLIISDKENALVLKKGEERKIPVLCVKPEDFADADTYERTLIEAFRSAEVELVALAGYMRLVGDEFINSFPYRIVNIHPALLPSFRGLHAQRQALEAGVRFSGCTVHMVDQGMDTGPIILQAVVPVDKDDDEESLANRILAEEHKIYWRALRLYCEGRLYVEGKRVLISEKV